MSLCRPENSPIQKLSIIIEILVLCQGCHALQAVQNSHLRLLSNACFFMPSQWCFIRVKYIIRSQVNIWQTKHITHHFILQDDQRRKKQSWMNGTCGNWKRTIPSSRQSMQSYILTCSHSPSFKKRTFDCDGFFAAGTSIVSRAHTVCGVIRVTICRVLSFSLLEDLSGWLHFFVSSPFNTRRHVTTLKTVILGTFTVQINRKIWSYFCLKMVLFSFIYSCRLPNLTKTLFV